MRKTLVLLLSLSVIFVLSCSQKNEAQKTVEKYYGLIKEAKYDLAYDMLDKESKELVEKDKFLGEARKIKAVSFYLVFKEGGSKINPENTVADFPMEYTGQKVSYNKLPGAEVAFHAVKGASGWEIRLQERINEIKEVQKQEAIEIPINPELIEAGKKYKDKIEVKDVRNGEVEFENGLTQYMMDATVKNNTDKPLSFVGVNVKFMDDTNTKVLLEKVFYLIYTRQIQSIYPIKPGEQRNVIIPGYAADDIQGNWTGKLQWEVYTVKVATPEELITLE